MEQTKKMLAGGSNLAAITAALTPASTTSIVKPAKNEFTGIHRERKIVNTHIQELAILMLGSLPIKQEISPAVNKSRKFIMNSLEDEEKALYTAGRDVLIELASQLGRCQNLQMLMKTLQVVQGITEGNVVEYEAVKDQLLDELPA